MKDRESSLKWFPFWIDKWIWGSMRIECSVIERAIWIDLLALASKDNGFIRANEDTPYLITQLAGMLVIPEQELVSAIKKFLDIGKLSRMENDTLCVAKWEKYQFCDRHKRRVEKEMSRKTDTIAGKTAPIRKDKIRKDKIIEDKNIKPIMLNGKKNNSEKFKDKINAIQKIWNSFAIKEGFTEALKLSESRKNKLRLRVKEELFDINKILTAAKKQPFLMGENERGWAITFDFIVNNDSNFIKILELYYLKKEKKSWAEKAEMKEREKQHD